MFRHTTFPGDDKSRIKQKRSHADENSGALASTQLPPAFALTKDSLALGFFYTKTLENLPKSDHARYLHMNLSPLYLSSRPQSALRLAALAMSHIAYSRYGRDDCQLVQFSRKFYVQAISAVNIALRDPVEAITDETLYAVLLLCGYEVSKEPSMAFKSSGIYNLSKFLILSNNRLVFVMSNRFRPGDLTSTVRLPS